MRCVCRLTVFLPLLILVPALAAPMTEADPAKEAEAKHRAKLLAARFFYAKLTAIDADGDEKKFTVEVPFQTKTPNADGQKKYQEVLKRYREAYLRRDANQVK